MSKVELFTKCKNIFNFLNSIKYHGSEIGKARYRLRGDSFLINECYDGRWLCDTITFDTFEKQAEWKRKTYEYLFNFKTESLHYRKKYEGEGALASPRLSDKFYVLLHDQLKKVATPVAEEDAMRSLRKSLGQKRLNEIQG